MDSQLATSSAISGVQELLNDCICCNLVGQLSAALSELRATLRPDRIVIETSGSAFPATLALEVNRLARETGGAYALDGVVSVVDVENWKGYEDTSYTARLQARYTDLIVFNKWEGCSERRFDECLDRLGDLELDTPWVKSNKGWVGIGLVFGIDGGLARELMEDHAHDDGHTHDHQSEVEVLSVELKGNGEGSKGVDVAKLHTLLQNAPREEVYRIKAVLTAAGTLRNSDEDMGIPTPLADGAESARYILNWAFGRWVFTPLAGEVKEHSSSSGSILRMTLILARYESTKWKKKLETGGFLEVDGGEGGLVVTKIA